MASFGPKYALSPISVACSSVYCAAIRPHQWSPSIGDISVKKTYGVSLGSDRGVVRSHNDLVISRVIVSTKTIINCFKCDINDCIPNEFSTDRHNNCSAIALFLYLYKVKESIFGAIFYKQYIV